MVLLPGTLPCADHDLDGECECISVAAFTFTGGVVPRLSGVAWGEPCDTLSSLLGGVLNGDTLSAGVGRGSSFTLWLTATGFVGILGLSARFTGGGKLFAVFWMELSGGAV